MAPTQPEPRAALLGRLDVPLVELGIAIGAGGDHHQVEALLQDGLAPVAHRLLAGRLDHDVGPELQQRLQEFHDGHLAADLLLRRLGAARPHQHAHDIDGGLLLGEHVEQRLADGAVADQRDFQPLLPCHARPRLPRLRCDYSGQAPRQRPYLRPWGVAAITRLAKRPGELCFSDGV